LAVLSPLSSSARPRRWLISCWGWWMQPAQGLLGSAMRLSPTLAPPVGAERWQLLRQQARWLTVDETAAPHRQCRRPQSPMARRGLAVGHGQPRWQRWFLQGPELARLQRPTEAVWGLLLAESWWSDRFSAYNASAHWGNASCGWAHLIRDLTAIGRTHRRQRGSERKLPKPAAQLVWAVAPAKDAAGSTGRQLQKNWPAIRQAFGGQRCSRWWSWDTNRGERSQWAQTFAPARNCCNASDAPLDPSGAPGVEPKPTTSRRTGPTPSR